MECSLLSRWPPVRLPLAHTPHPLRVTLLTATCRSRTSHARTRHTVAAAAQLLDVGTARNSAAAFGSGSGGSNHPHHAGSSRCDAQQGRQVGKTMSTHDRGILWGLFRPDNRNPLPLLSCFAGTPSSPRGPFSSSSATSSSSSSLSSFTCRCSSFLAGWRSCSPSSAHPIRCWSRSHTPESDETIIPASHSEKSRPSRADAARVRTHAQEHGMWHVFCFTQSLVVL